MEINKTTKVCAIKEHLAKKGRKMTNLQSSTNEDLDKYVTRYEIDIETYARERKEKMVEEKRMNRNLKITKIAKQNAIKEHLTKQNKRLRYLHTSTNERLDRFITTYKIDIVNYVLDKREEKKEIQFVNALTKQVTDEDEEVIVFEGWGVK